VDFVVQSAPHPVLSVLQVHPVGLSRPDSFQLEHENPFDR